MGLAVITMQPLHIILGPMIYLNVIAHESYYAFYSVLFFFMYRSFLFLIHQLPTFVLYWTLFIVCVARMILEWYITSIYFIE